MKWIPKWSKISHNRPGHFCQKTRSLFPNLPLLASAPSLWVRHRLRWILSAQPRARKSVRLPLDFLLSVPSGLVFGLSLMLQQNSSCSLPLPFSIPSVYLTDYTTWPPLPCSCCVPSHNWDRNPAQPQAIPARWPDNKVGYCDPSMLSLFPQTQSSWLLLVLQWSIIPQTPHLQHQQML